MKKLLILSLFLGAFYAKNFAQISGGATLGPMISDGEAIFGLTLNGKYELSDKLKVGANLGFFSKNQDFLGTSVRTSIMPFSGLIEYKLIENKLNPYTGLDLGFYRFGIAGFSATYLGLAPTAGVNYEIDDKLSINGNFKYHYIMSSDLSSTGLININAGISYKLN